MKKKVFHRQEIDGLRALAVLPVILFHAGFSVFSGGYVGVDVFFVISGYLITFILLREMAAGRFSIIDFYERRARRILPALFVVLIVTTILALLLMMPEQLKHYSRNLLATSLFFPNIRFTFKTDYFDPAAEQNPLLHMWSLGVEEQFYLVFPLIVIALWRFGLAKLWWIVAGLGLLSLAYSEWGWRNATYSTFFFTPMRAFELCAGVLIAIAEQRGHFTKTSWWSSSLAILGIVLIGFAVFAFDAQTPFPSVYAIVPVLGTALIIAFARGKTLAAQVLSWRAFVGIGLISYSAYLWHQPLLAFARVYSFDEPSETLLVTMAVMSLVLAYFTWRYVEQPFRNRKASTRKQIFTWSLIGILIFVGIGAAGSLTKGFDKAWYYVSSDEIKEIMDYRRGPKPSKLCHTSFNKYVKPALDNCTIGDDNAPTTAMLWGDSHAEAIVPGVDNMLQRVGVNATQQTHGACPPVLGVYDQAHVNESFCPQYSNEIFELIVTNPQIETIILSARWQGYLESNRFNNTEGGVEPPGVVSFVPGTGKKWEGSDKKRKELIAKQYVEMVNTLLNLGKQVIIIYPVPEVGWHPIERAIKAERRKHPSRGEISTKHEVFKERNKSAYDTLDSLLVHPNLHRVIPEKIFCNTFIKDRCVVQKDGVIYYSDDDHVNHKGAELIAFEIEKILRRINVE